MFDPIFKLQLLGRYMNNRIDVYPSPYKTFTRYINHGYPQYIRGSKEYYRRIATHCYYCDREFKEYQGGFAKSIDHFQPKGTTKEYIYVICCERCNGLKGNLDPLNFLNMVMKRYLGKKTPVSYRSHNGKKVNTSYTNEEVAVMKERVSTVVNAIMYGIATKHFYICKLSATQMRNINYVKGEMDP